MAQSVYDLLVQILLSFLENYISQVKILSLKSSVKADVFISRGWKENESKVNNVGKSRQHEPKVFSAFSTRLYKSFFTLMLSPTVISAVLDTS